MLVVHGSVRGSKQKALVMMPAGIVLGAQADGWWMRSVIIWAKPNPMPESVTDRPTDSYEHILMLTKSARYFWDADAVREKADPANERKDVLRGPKNAERQADGDFSESPFTSGFPGTRNLRKRWHLAT